MSLQRCFWSEYKQRPTVKHAVACSGNACVTFASDGYAGSSPDVTVAIASGFLKTLYTYMSSMADKGFLLHAEFVQVLHELLTPPKKLRHQDTFTIDESEWTSKIAQCRVVIENVGRSWKLMNRKIKVFSPPCRICLCVLMAMCVVCMFACV